MALPTKPVITIKEARKLLGRFFQGYSDEQILQMVAEMDFMADVSLRMVQKTKVVN